VAAAVADAGTLGCDDPRAAVLEHDRHQLGAQPLERETSSSGVTPAHTANSDDVAGPEPIAGSGGRGRAGRTPPSTPGRSNGHHRHSPYDCNADQSTSSAYRTTARVAAFGSAVRACSWDPLPRQYR